MLDTERVHLFSNGENYRIWKWNNCKRCVKLPRCPLEYAIASANMLDGTITPDIAERLGVPPDGSEKWWCREFDDGAQPTAERAL